MTWQAEIEGGVERWSEYERVFEVMGNNIYARVLRWEGAHGIGET